MTSLAWEHLNRVWKDNDPLGYLAQHGGEIFEALEAEKKATDKWNTLKNTIMAMSSSNELIAAPDGDTYYSCDQKWGFDECLIRIENIIKRLENNE